MKLARGLVSIAMSTVRDQSPTLPTPDYSPDPGVILADIAQKVSAMEVILERKADKDKIRSLVAISDEALLLQAKDIILAGEVKFVDLLQDWNGTNPGAVNPKITTIRGGVIRTGKLLSTNWSVDDGSCLDLDNGNVIIGGSENPGLLYSKATGLVIDGSVTANSFILNGSSEPPTLGDLVDLAENAITTEDFLDELNQRLADGVGSVLAGMNGDYRLELGTSSIILAHKDANLSGIGSSYTGDLRTGVALTANGIAMGFNRKSDGAWVNGVSINSAGIVSFAGSLAAATGTFAGSLSAVTGSFYGSIQTSGQVKATGSTSVTGGGNAAIVGQPSSTGVVGVVGAALDSPGVMGLSNTGYGGTFNGGAGGLYAYTVNNTPAAVFSTLFGAPAIQIDAGRIVKPRATGHYIRVWATAIPDQFEYEFV